MYKIDNQERYREIIYSGGALNSATLTINNVEVPVSQIKSIKFSSPIIDTSQDYFYIGTFNAQKVEIQFKNADNIDLSGIVYIAINTNVDGELVEVPMGNFLIDTSPEDYYKFATITCYDKSILFKTNIDIRTFFDEETQTVTAENLLKGLCSYYLGDDMLGTYPNVNLDATTGSYDDSQSGKYYISQIAEIMGGNAKIGRDGKLYIMPLKSDPVVTIDALKSKSWTISSHYKISRVFFEDLYRKYEFGEETDNSLNIRSTNVFVNGNDENGREIIENLYNALNGFEMYAIKIENYGEPTLDCWDIINYDLDGTIYPTFYDNTLTYEQNIMSTVDVKIPSKQKAEVTNVVRNENSWRNTIENVIDQVEGQISTTITRIQEVSDGLGNTYTREQINELIQNAELGLTNTFSLGGGNNLLTNTAPYRVQKDNNNNLESWEGNAEQAIEPSSINGYAILLNDGILSQTVTLPTGDYAIGFKWKRLIAGASLQIRYNGREITIKADDTITVNDETNFEARNNEITSNGMLTNNEFIIYFESDISRAFEIYELRLVHGNIALPWTQNQNEIKTKSVNIGDGITIDSEQAQTLNRLDTDGMVVYNRNKYLSGERETAEVLRVSATGIVTNDFTSKGISNVSGLLIQRVKKSHIFISGLKESE